MFRHCNVRLVGGALAAIDLEGAEVSRLKPLPRKAADYSYRDTSNLRCAWRREPAPAAFRHCNVRLVGGALAAIDLEGAEVSRLKPLPRKAADYSYRDTSNLRCAWRREPAPVVFRHCNARLLGAALAAIDLEDTEVSRLKPLPRKAADYSYRDTRIYYRQAVKNGANAPRLGAPPKVRAARQPAPVTALQPCCPVSTASPTYLKAM